MTPNQSMKLSWLYQVKFFSCLVKLQIFTCDLTRNDFVSIVHFFENEFKKLLMPFKERNSTICSETTWLTPRLGASEPLPSCYLKPSSLANLMWNQMKRKQMKAFAIAITTSASKIHSLFDYRYEFDAFTPSGKDAFSQFFSPHPNFCLDYVIQ